MIEEVRQSVRALRRTPGFTLAALLSVAIGVGANTAIFSVAHALLLRPLPYKDASRLVILWNRSPGLGIAEDWFSTAQYFDIKHGHGGLEEVAIAIGGMPNLTGDGEPQRIGTIRMSSNLLPLLGARAALGRLLAPEDDTPGRKAVAVLGYGTWIRRYGGDPHVLGRMLRLNGQPYEIVGVLPSTFALPREVMPTLNGAEDAEIVVPLPLATAAETDRDHEDYNVVAKLKPGVSRAAAQAEMDTITARLRREHPDVYPPNGGLTFGIVPLQDQVVGDVRSSLLLLVGSVALVLVIACANVANLLLARALARQRELSVRAALGASRARLARQVLVESLLLGVGGGAIAVVMALGGLELIRALGEGLVPRLHEIEIDRTVLLFTLALSIVASAVFGLVPAWRVGRVDPADGLKDSGRGAAGSALWGRGGSTRRLLVISELALAVILLVGAGLLVRSFAQLQRVSPGFNPDRVLTFELTMTGRRYTEASAVLAAYRELWQRLKALPGVTAAGGVSALPLSQMFAWGPITVEGRAPAPGEAFLNADLRFVGGDYFTALQIPLIAGRLFDEHDTRDAQLVAIVDQFMAEQLWPKQSAIGRRVKSGGADSKEPWLTVVGVVGRVKQYTLDADSRIALYLPQPQLPVRGMNVVLRGSSDDVGALSAAVTREVRAVDPDLPIYHLRTMAARVGDSLGRRRFSMMLLTLFAIVSAGLAALGVYSVMAYLVNQGRRELGIRLALGATPQGMARLIVGRAMTVAAWGIGIGLAGAWVATRFMRSLLFNVEPTDPLTLVVIPVLLTLVAVLAAWTPARRASRIDPLESLRSE